MSSRNSLNNVFNRASMDDRAVNELVGLAAGIIADGKVNQAEAEFLQKWLSSNAAARNNPITATLLQRITEALEDGYLDEEEAADLFNTLQSFSGGDFELGEMQKSSTLPLCSPAPEVDFMGKIFVFTGTFAFGSRRECENAARALGGKTGRLTKKSNYLVIGVYATDSWAHSSYGRKIEQAVEMRESGVPISIIGEEHWLTHLPPE